MTLKSELSSWKMKNDEAERKLEDPNLSVQERNKFGEQGRTSSENIARIESVLVQHPLIDETKAEELRHYNATKEIDKREASIVRASKQ